MGFKMFAKINHPQRLSNNLSGDGFVFI